MLDVTTALFLPCSTVSSINNTALSQRGGIWDPVLQPSSGGVHKLHHSCQDIFILPLVLVRSLFMSYFNSTAGYICSGEIIDCMDTFFKGCTCLFAHICMSVRSDHMWSLKTQQGMGANLIINSTRAFTECLTLYAVHYLTRHIFLLIVFDWV